MNKTKGKASSVIRKMLELQPKTAILKKDEIQEEIPIELLQEGDMVIVKPGEKIPVDSIVVGGTINREGALVLKTLKGGRDTFLSQVVSLVEEAMGQKPPMQRLVD